MILLSLCVVSILSVYIFDSYPKHSKNKQPNEVENATNIFKERGKQEPIKQKALNELEAKKPAIKNKSTAINSKRADKELEEQFNNLLEDEEILRSVANLGFEARRFQQNKSRFYDRATQEQKNKGKEVLNKLRSAMNIPPNLQFQATFDKKNHENISYTCNCFFKSPNYYREDATGEFTYKYVTDGIFEITNFAEDIVERSPGIVSRDIDKNVFLEVFPARIMLDSDILWQDKKILSSKENVETEVEVVGNWLYGMNVRTSDHLIHQLTFYDRNDMSHKKQIIRIYDIVYKSFEIVDPSTKVKSKCTLPTHYTITYNDDAQIGETYTVNLEYKDFNKEIPKKIFHLNLDAD